ncbi:NAD(P)-dependent oxidoreductase [Microbacterium tumbae]
MSDNGMVGFIGLGRMGWPMAANLAAAGFDLIVHDADGALARRFAVEHGATAATGPADFAPAGVLITMLPNGAIVQDSLLGWGDGIAPAIRDGAVVVDMSSSSPEDTLALAALLEPHGLRLVDAPVSGGVPRAVSGELSLMVGGEDEDVAAVIPVLDVLGDPQRRFRTGRLGTGHAMKAMNNYVAAATYVATAEALVVGKEYGLAPATAIDVINTSTGRSFVSEVVFGEVVSGRYSTGFLLGLLAKDVRIARELAVSAAVDAPMSALVDARWSQALDAVGGGQDHSAAHRAWWSETLSE